MLVRRFGLMNHQEATLDQVSAEVGLTRERVRQIQMDALKRLRNLLHLHGLNCNDVFTDPDDSASYSVS